MVCHSRPAAAHSCESCGLNPLSHTACAHLGGLQQKPNVLQHLQKPIVAAFIKTPTFCHFYLGILQNRAISIHVCSQPYFQKTPLLLPTTPQLGGLQKNPNVLLLFTKPILASFKHSSMFCNLLTTSHAPNPIYKHFSPPSPSRHSSDGELTREMAHFL